MPDRFKKSDSNIIICEINENANRKIDTTLKYVYDYTKSGELEKRYNTFCKKNFA